MTGRTAAADVVRAERHLRRQAGIDQLAFLNLTQAAALVRVDRSTLRAAIDRGELATAPTRPRSIRIARAELDRWAMRRT